jgi:hypothetical protein
MSRGLGVVYKRPARLDREAATLILQAEIDARRSAS